MKCITNPWTLAALAMTTLMVLGCNDEGDLLQWSGGWTPEALWGAEGDLGGDLDTDGDMDSDSDGDGDTDSDTDSDTDTDTDTDTGSPDAGGVDSGPLKSPVGSLPLGAVPAPKVLYLSADDSNSQSSPVLVRSLIENGQIVDPTQLRVWEFLNYYDFSYAPPSSAPIAVTQQFRPYDIPNGLYALQIGVQGRHVATAARRPANITLVVDTSGSMGGSPISLLRDVCNEIASSLKSGDRVSMVSWDTSQAVVLDSLAVTGPDDPTLLSAIATLTAGGGTDLHGGLTAGYQLAEQNFLEGGLNRVVLISDGGANVGITDEELIAQHAEAAEDEAIFMVGVGVGDGNYYNDLLMDTVTDWGKGASIFIDSPAEAEKMFHDRFLATMEVTALDVRVEMTLPPYFDMDQFFGEEYSENPDEVEPQHLSPNDAMIYQQLIKTTQPKQVYASYTIGLNVTYTDAITGAQGTESTSSTLQSLVFDPCDELRKGDAIVQYVQTLGRVYQMAIAGSQDVAAAELCDEAIDAIETSASILVDADLTEIASLLTEYCMAQTPYIP